MDNRRAYKLVDQDGYTRRGDTGETLWLPVGKTVEPTGEGSKPCGPGVLHGYIIPEVAMLGNPIHAATPNPRLLLIESNESWSTDGFKRWTTGDCTVLEECSVSDRPIEEIVAWAICTAMHPHTCKWAVSWLSGEDRSVGSAWEVSILGKVRDWQRPYTIAAEAACYVAVNRPATARKLATLAIRSAVRQSAGTKARKVASYPSSVPRRENKLDAPWLAAELALVEKLRKARAILAGEYPAEKYGAPYIT